MKTFWCFPVVILALCGCQPVEREERSDSVGPLHVYERDVQEHGRIFDPSSGMLSLFSANADHTNRHLFQAASETLAFMGIESASLVDGLIETGWYTKAGERVKIIVTILSGKIEVSGLGVTVLSHKKEKEGWVATPPSAALESEVREAILLRARELRSRGLRGG